MPANHTGILYLLTQLLNENISTDELAELISNDVCISHKLLKYINSAANHKNVQIKSMHDAVIMCGMKTLKNWTMLIALSAIDNKPDALITYSLIRAKMCSILAKNTPGQEHESCFTIGLLSVIDAMMDQPLAEIMQSLPLASDLKDALLSHKGEKGNILKCTIAYEHADWDNAHYGSLSSEEMADVYIEAVNWAEINLLQLVA